MLEQVMAGRRPLLYLTARSLRHEQLAQTIGAMRKVILSQLRQDQAVILLLLRENGTIYASSIVRASVLARRSITVHSG